MTKPEKRCVKGYLDVGVLTASMLDNARIYIILYLAVLHGFAGVVVYLYAAGLIYSACIRIAGAFRKTEIVYIQ